MISSARWSTIAMVPLLLVISLRSSLETRAPQQRDVAGQSWEQAIQASLASMEYEASADAGDLQAPNRAHNLRTHFRARGIEVVPREAPADWHFGWEMVGWGRPGRITHVDRAVPIAAGPRVTYTRPGIVEWYENSPRGLEQGFTVDRRPPGEGALTIEGRVLGGLRAERRDDGEAIDFLDARGAKVLRYAELHVWDANGVELAAKLDAGGDRLAIAVNDGGATYPLTIDPLMTNPAWTGEGNQDSAQFGHSVATAGDVNGDGYSDVIVGAFAFDNGDQDEGKAFVFHGSPAGLLASPSWTAEGNQFNAWFGWAVGTAGDVNGDGYADVIVSAHNYTNGELNEGRVHVYLGSAAGLAASPAWTAEGNQMNAVFGSSAGTAGDVNRDGRSDVIIGARNYDNGQTDEGRAFVYHGTASGLATTPAWTAEGNQATAWFGWTSGTAGDVNGDGYADVIVGAALYDNGSSNEGRAFVYHGSPGGLAASAAWTAESNQIDACLANSVAMAGDVNGDGYGDVMIGASLFDNGQIDEGKVLVYHGSAAGLAASPAWTSESNQVDAEHGHSVGIAGDVNGDGFADVIVGARAFTNGEALEGRAVVYQGSPSGLAPSPVWTVEGDQASAQFGWSVATAGDVNGDGYSDVTVGAKLYTNGQNSEGRAFAYHGSAAGLTLIASQFLEINQVNSGFGIMVAPAGDVNGDGYSDVIVGAASYDNGELNEGAAFVYHGSRAGIGANPNWMAEGNQASSRFGEDAATAGDVNGDGYSDIILGAYDFDNGHTDEGRAYVYLGSPTGLGSAPVWITESNQFSGWWGRSVASAGDVNGDGYSDIIVGAPGYNIDPFDGGGTFVFLGSATGLAIAPDWSAECNQDLANFGTSVSTAGDVNGDGFSDVVIGAVGFDNGEDLEGRAFVYHGSPTGLGDAAAWTAESNQAESSFGQSVATLGDLNADGYSDVIVGAFRYDLHHDDGGAAFIYLGSPLGLDANAQWFFAGNQEFASLGYSVGTAGDVNGDGYSDVILGAPTASVASGNAFVFHGAGEGPPVFGWGVVGTMNSRFGTSVATAGDVNGDGFSDVIVGATLHTNGQSQEGAAFVYLGNGGLGLDRIAVQRRTNNSAPIGVLGRSDSPSGFLLTALGRSAAGRTRVSLQAEVKPFGVPFDGTGLVIGQDNDTGQPGPAGSAFPVGVLGQNLASNQLYHWRARILSQSPFVPSTPWIWQPMNGLTEADLRTGQGPIAVSDDLGAPPRGKWLAPAAPNPFAAFTELSYTLPERGRVRLGIYDVQGRLVAPLADELRPSGDHAVRWDGRNAGGHSLPRGVYLIRLEFAGKVETQKIVLSR